MMHNLYTLTDFIFLSYVAEIDVYRAKDVKTGIFIDNVAIDTLKTLRDITFYDLSLSTILTLPFGGVHLRTSYVKPFRLIGSQILYFDLIFDYTLPRGPPFHLTK